MKILILNLTGDAIREVTKEIGHERWIVSKECSDPAFDLWDVTIEAILKVYPGMAEIFLDYCGTKASIRIDDFELIKIL